MNKKLTSKKEKQPRKGLLERRDRILEAAALVFAEKGIERATIDDVAERAGVGKGTIYRRIGSKDELIGFLLKEAARLLVDAIKKGVQKKVDPVFQFKEVVNVLCDFYEKNMALVILLVPQCVPYVEIMQSKIKDDIDIAKEVFQAIENVLRKAIHKKEIRAVNTHVVAKGLISFLNPYLYQYLRSKANYSKSEIAQLTIDLFLDGLRVRK